MIDWLTETLLASGFLLCLVLLLGRTVAVWAGPKAAYALWLLPLARILTPPLPIGGSTFLDLVGIVGPQVSDVTSRQLLLNDAQPSSLGQDWQALLAFVWLGGAAICMVYQLLRHHRFTQVLLATKRGGDFQIGNAIVWTSAAAQGPLALGLLRPQIVLPSDFQDRFNESERELVFAHELMHHRRRDLIANVAALAVLSFHWFNPLAHIAFRRFREDQEMACDADVIAARGVVARYDYGRALAKAACQRGSWPLCTLRPADVLKMRLASLAADHRGGQADAAKVAVFTTFAAILFLISPRVSPASSLDRSVASNEIWLGGRPSAVEHRPSQGPHPYRGDAASPDLPIDGSHHGPGVSAERYRGLKTGITGRAALEHSIVTSAMAHASAEETIAESYTREDAAGRTALEWSVVTVAMKSAPAKEATVEAQHAQSWARPPT